ncbi:Serine/threonine-protein kinase PrkC [Planctomycetes bacterium Pan216]|uniref:Serine/threonine-protein kinase PrkC n=2 Tax=Kolteria novifilia TaxID=2527975 RepID=A0A518B7E4_9BACT|nr:Serine/threonine-protein kinase PrkC [Planctomycetes bacterium Pan216]
MPATVEKAAPLAKPKEGKAMMEFTYKSGARPLDGYTIKRGLGVGGFGEVYYAISDGGKEVALKLIRRYLDVERRGIAQCLNLKHANLLSIFDVRENAAGESWVVMEHLGGDSLRTRLDKADGSLDRHEVLEWLGGIAAAVDYLHDHGIVHRDLKPANIFSEHGVIKVGDYGLSKFITQSRRSGQTESVGTVHYMAPEVSTGNYGRSVDVYAVAIMAYEMITADVPFDGETSAEVLMKHLTAEPDLGRLDKSLKPIFAKAFSKEPGERFATARELRDAVAAGLGLAGAGRVDALPPRQKKKEEGLGRTTPYRERGRFPSPLANTLPPLPGTPQATRRELSNTLWSLFLAGVLSFVMPAIALTYEIVFHNRVPEVTEYFKNHLTLAVMSGTASWGLLVFARWWRFRQTDRAARRLNLLIFGLGLGVLAAGINIWIDHQLPVPLALGQNPFSQEGLKSVIPMVLVYATLFGLSFSLPNWSRLVSPKRAERFSLGWVIWPSCLGMVIAALMQRGPEVLWFGCLLASTAVIVQWVSPFETMKRRRRPAGG